MVVNQNLHSTLLCLKDNCFHIKEYFRQTQLFSSEKEMCIWEACGKSAVLKDLPIKKVKCPTCDMSKPNCCHNYF